MKEQIEVFDYAGKILKNLKNGALLTAKAGDRINSMIIGWGALGIDWAKPTFTAYVREGRYTRELLDAGDSFTVSVPINGIDKQIFKVMGTTSGRNMDKAAESGITYVPGEKVASPAVKQYPLTLECRILYRKRQEESAMDPAELRWYPQDVDSSNVGANKDFHVEYIGEIVSAYIIH